MYTTTGMITDKIKLAYIAGIIDGDGHISITRNVSKTCKRGYRHRIQIAVTNSDLRLIRRLKNWFGGHIQKIQRPQIYRKQCYTWKLWAVNEQLDFLRLVKPQLFIKKSRAKICIDFLENGGLGYGKMKRNKETGRMRGLIDGEFERREKLCKKIQYENKRFTRLAAETKREGEDILSSKR